MDMTLPRSRIVRIEIEVAIPEAATREQVEEWVRFETGRGGCEEANPLLDWDMEAISAPILTDTHMHLHETAVDNGDGTYLTRRWRAQEPFVGERARDTVAKWAMARRQ